MKKEKHAHQPKEKAVVKNKATIRLLYFIVFLLPVVIYFNTRRNGYVLDDFSVIKENWVVKQGSGAIPMIFKTSYRYGYWGTTDDLYRPLPLSMFALEWGMWPDNPAPGHVINIIMYALCCIALFHLLRRLLPHMNAVFPFIVTLLFAAHPIHTEVVANIKSRDELLCFLFLLTTSIAMLKYIGKGKILWLVVAALLYFLAFLSKESAITFLAVFPLLIYFFTNSTLKRGAIFSLVMVIPAVLFLAIRQKVLGDAPDASPVSVADNLLVAAPDALTRFATAIKIMGMYLWKLIFPYTLVSDYSYNQIPVNGAGDIGFILSFLFFAGISVFAILKIRKKHILSFTVLFFLATMSIYSNVLVLIGSSFGERFLFVPSISFAILTGWVLFLIKKSAFTDPAIMSSGRFFSTYKLPVLIILPVIILYSVQTIARNREWESNLVLYSADVKKSPESAHMRYYYGLVLMKDMAMDTNSQVVKPAYLDSAIHEFTEAARIIPTYADAYDQIGLAYFRKGDNQKALENYSLALKYNPQKSITYSNMGVIYFNAGQMDKALEIYQEAVKYNPSFADGWLNLGSTLGTMQRFPEAVEAFKQCITYNPENAMAHYFLGLTYQSLGDKANSDFYLQKAAQMDPKYAQKPASVNK